MLSSCSSMWAHVGMHMGVLLLWEDLQGGGVGQRGVVSTYCSGTSAHLGAGPGVELVR